MSRYGVNGDRVADFLAEVRSCDLARWQALAEVVRAPSPERSAATKALSEASIPGGVRSAVASAAESAFADLGLASADFPARMSRGMVRVSISTAAMAIAAGENLEDGHRRALLEPFVEQHFTSAAAALARPDDH